jgi:large conductance mechanosensitive channel
MAFVVFLLVKLMNKIASPSEKQKPEPIKRYCPYCFTEVKEKATRCPACTSNLEN